MIEGYNRKFFWIKITFLVIYVVGAFYLFAHLAITVPVPVLQEAPFQPENEVVQESNTSDSSTMGNKSGGEPSQTTIRLAEHHSAVYKLTRSWNQKPLTPVLQCALPSRVRNSQTSPPKQPAPDPLSNPVPSFLAPWSIAFPLSK